MHSVKAIAHRGAFKAKNLPENSIASLREAHRLGCYGSEFDVHILADNELTVYHDDTLNSIPVCEISSNELKNHQLFDDDSICLLDNYLTAAESMSELHLFLEVKQSNSQEKTLEAAEKCFQLVKGKRLLERTHFITFDFVAGQLLGNSGCTVSYLEGDKTPEEIMDAGFTGINYHFDVFYEHPDWVRAAQALGLTVNSWTVNEKEDMLFLMHLGVDFITTDEPELLIGLINHFR